MTSYISPAQHYVTENSDGELNVNVDPWSVAGGVMAMPVMMGFAWVAGVFFV